VVVRSGQYDQQRLQQTQHGTGGGVDGPICVQRLVFRHRAHAEPSAANNAAAVTTFRKAGNNNSQRCTYIPAEITKQTTTKEVKMYSNIAEAEFN
jgi:hypothetical protein